MLTHFSIAAATGSVFSQYFAYDNNDHHSHNAAHHLVKCSPPSLSFTTILLILIFFCLFSQIQLNEHSIQAVEWRIA